MPESFGARMRQQREQRHVSLAAIAEQTKIKQSLLEAMERDDVSQWPSGIFRRSFMRSYAQAIGSDADAVVRDFLASYPDPSEEVAAFAAAAASDAANARATPPTRLQQLVGSAETSLTRLRSSAPAPADAFAAQVSEPAPTLQAASASDAVPVPTFGVTAPADSPEDLASVRALRKSPHDDLAAVADLCTQLSKAERTDDLSPLLKRAARILGANGLVVWTWDPEIQRLRASWAHGYSDSTLSHLPTVTRDASNPTAAAFRHGQVRSINGSDSTRGALAVPLMAAHGCVGVLAMELPGRETSRSIRALATILAAQFARILEQPAPLSAARKALLETDDLIHQNRLTLATQ